ncbi:MBL fold metallo-hydrolase [Stakelama marina]|uniref:MBL fold metallo-hydrolase n=1 Tax=Stakelama marina TaxID=2826939 RepID=A0A8T4ID39_9SPHN|nr:MBL fold metallo-hydrolase [Stakelama marina]MBR0552403.1 MBL fold metallo-hydrolase [Stakelama marina]
MATTVPDRSSDDTRDDNFVATSHRGLTYPFGDRAPELGDLIPVAPGIGWGRLPLRGSLGHVNVYALDDGAGGDAVTLVDSGMNLGRCKKHWKAIFDGPLAGREVLRVIGTHMHPDHVGLAGWLCERFDCRLWMTRGEWLTIRMLAADARDETPAEMIAFWQGAGWTDEQIETAAAKGWGRIAQIITPLPLGYRRIGDGETIAIGSRTWQVIVGSGHSPEHACLYDPAEGVLLAGDQVLPRISSNVSLGVTEPESDPLGEWLASIEKLRALPPDILVCPGHGSPFHGLHKRLDALRDEHRKRLDMLEAHLSEPRRAVDCFGRMFRRTIGEDVIGLATGETLAHLRRLEVEGRAIRTVRDGVWWYAAA